MSLYYAILNSVAVSNSASAPLTYLWRSNNIQVAAETTWEYQAVYRVGPVSSNVNYIVIVTNDFGPPGALSARANLTVLADSDGDGLPDEFEDGSGLDRNNPGDATLDPDGDGVSNLAEYQAGTDPADRENVLRVDRWGAELESAFLEFSASSNKTYAVEYRDMVTLGTWELLKVTPARATNFVEHVVDPAPALRRFYRLRTPASR